MKKFASKKENESFLFNTKDEALQHVQNHSDRTYDEYNEWKYYAPNLNNHETGYRSFTGENLIKAIENNFDLIAKEVYFYGVSGYILQSVTLTDNFNNTATLTIIGWSFSEALIGFKKSMLNDNNKKIINIDILDITKYDIPNGFYKFEIK